MYDPNSISLNRGWPRRSRRLSASTSSASSRRIRRFADVGAMHVGGVTYINTDFQEHGFVQLAGHELLHQIRRERPSIYDWFAQRARLSRDGCRGTLSKPT
jgi:hypothetical protein